MRPPLDCFFDFSAQQETLPTGLSRTLLSGSLRHNLLIQSLIHRWDTLFTAFNFLFLRLPYPLLGITGFQIIRVHYSKPLKPLRKISHFFRRDVNIETIHANTLTFSSFVYSFLLEKYSGGKAKVLRCMARETDWNLYGLALYAGISCWFLWSLP